MDLHISGESDLVDSPLRFRVSGTTADTVDFIVSTADAAGAPWRSSASYAVGPGGWLDLPDLDSPWATMQNKAVDRPAAIFENCATEIEFAITANTAHDSATQTVPRRWGLDLRTERITGDGWVLQIYRPPNDQPCLPGIVVLPGTMVGRSIAATTALLASHGYVTATLYYTQQPGLPDAFSRIATEDIAGGIEAFRQLPYVDGEAVAVHAGSVGVQTALATLITTGTAVRAVVAVAPSHVVFQALRDDGPPQKMSALTHGGEDLPYVPVKSERLLPQVLRNELRRRISRTPTSTALATSSAYEAGLRDASAVAEATLRVEDIDCPMLVIAGTADRCYPAAPMAAAIIDRREAARNPFAAQDELRIYDDVGHFIRPPAIPTTVDRSSGLISGGSPAATAAAQRDAWTHILRFLRTQLRVSA